MQSVDSARGSFVWFELMTPDVEAAIPFYKAVVGWDIEAWGEGPDAYKMWKTPAGPTVGGVMKLPEAARAMGAPPHWIGNLCVSDVDAAVATLQASGGTVYNGPFDIPGIGRVAIVADPSGATFALYQPSGEAPGHAGPPEIGENTWAELMTDDTERALSFYAGLTGWVKTGAMDMGPMGTYQMFGFSETCMVGGMMKRPPEMPVSAWTYYISVPDLDASIKRAQELGGRLLHGPIDVPGGARAANLMDPQGAMFSLLGPACPTP